MFDFIKRKLTGHKETQTADAVSKSNQNESGRPQQISDQTKFEAGQAHQILNPDDFKVQAKPSAASVEHKTGLFARLRQGLQRTRNHFGEAIARLTLGKKQIDDELFEELETLLLSADLGMATTQHILEQLVSRVSRQELTESQALLNALTEILVDILKPCEQIYAAKKSGDKPTVIMFVGVNGVGKTTTIGKLAAQYSQEGQQVLLAAGDTFRAAAIEQLQSWGARTGLAVVAQHQGADSASVVFDALQGAIARKTDILLADTAGRLHTKTNLMAELQKVKRVLAKLDPQAPQEIWLVVDAGTGQNALQQAMQFHEAVGLTGICLTKLDGTAKGGVIFAIAQQLKVPIRYIGIGEGIDDLRPFVAQDFVKALVGVEAPQ